MQITNTISSPILKNTYRFTLIDNKTKKIKQEIISHNLLTIEWWKQQDYYGSFSSLSLGSGNGIPSFTDLQLFHFLWERKIDSIKTNKINDQLCEIILTVIFPATSEYIGNITEAGLKGYANGSHIITHCLITDTEGNPITINKTAEDKLTVTVICKIILPEENNGFKFLPVDKGDFSRLGKLHDFGIFRDSTCLGFLRNRKPVWTGTGAIQTGLGATNAKLTRENSYRTIIYNTQRMVSSEGNTHYYPCLSVNGIGYYVFPNISSFPPYPINSINIGIGDGVKTKFKNPLNYFMKDTDVIYINGQPKQRGIDYTIDSENNFDMLNELSAGNWIKDIRSEADGQYDYEWSYYGRYPQVIFSCHELGPDARNSDKDRSGIYFKLNTPIYIELEEIKKINTFSLRNARYNESQQDLTISVKIEYSNDKKDYKEAFVSENFNLFSNKIFNFNAIETLYLKITLIGDSSNKEAIWLNYANNIDTPFLGYVGDDQITFKTPPALDDVITMDVKMDIPFKNENYSIDASVKFEFV